MLTEDRCGGWKSSESSASIMDLDSNLIYTIYADEQVIGYSVRGAVVADQALRDYRTNGRAEVPQMWVAYEQLLRRDHGFSPVLDRGVIRTDLPSVTFWYEAQ